MWPFKRKILAEQTQNLSEICKQRVAEIRAWRDIGQEFEYLGRKMVVISHSRLAEIGGFMLVHVPELRVRYADDTGKIHEMVMRESEALALARKDSA